MPKLTICQSRKHNHQYQMELTKVQLMVQLLLRQKEWLMGPESFFLMSVGRNERVQLSQANQLGQLLVTLKEKSLDLLVQKTVRYQALNWVNGNDSQPHNTDKTCIPHSHRGINQIYNQSVHYLSVFEHHSIYS